MSHTTDPLEQLWSDVDAYLATKLLQHDPILDAALAASDAAGLPQIQVSATQGKMLMLLAHLVSAERILEIGTLGGFSTIWLARGLSPGGKVITLEYDPKHAEVARANMACAGLSQIVDVRTGKAIDLLPKVAAAAEGPFDVTFIDADKASTPEYFQWAVKLSRPGSLIIVDNVIRDGDIVDATSDDHSVQGMRRFFDMLTSDKRVDATALQTVGVKGYDGFAIAMVVAPSSTAH